jgi:hypothetical protein
LGKFSSAVVVHHSSDNRNHWLNKELHLTGVPQPQHSGFSRREKVLLWERIEHHRADHSLYEAGRLAWLTDNLDPADGVVIVVEDLYAGTKKVFRNASAVQYGRSLSLQALGDKLLVAGTSRAM